MLLFVYGTLRRGEPAHELLGAAPFLGALRTAPRFELVDFGCYPALVRGGATAVVGELYDVAADAYPVLDAYEGCPQLFARAAIEIEGGALCEAYLLPEDAARGRPRIASGDWKARRL